MTKCPICDLQCVVNISSDFAECPNHGKFSGMALLTARGMQPWEALIEIRSEQLHFAAHRAFDSAKWAVMSGKKEWEYPFA